MKIVLFDDETVRVLEVADVGQLNQLMADNPAAYVEAFPAAA